LRPSTCPGCTRPALRLARSVTRASRVDLSSCLVGSKHPGVHCLAARHSLGSSAHRTPRGPTSALPPFGFRPFHSTRGRIRVVLTALSSEELTLTRVSVPRCRSSSGCPVGCGASFGWVRDCSRLAGLHPFSGCLSAGGRLLQRLRVEGQQIPKVLPASRPKPFIGGPTEGCPSPRRGRITGVLRWSLVHCGRSASTNPSLRLSSSQPQGVAAPVARTTWPSEQALSTGCSESFCVDFEKWSEDRISFKTFGSR
jgi:hypothetical protein